MDLDTLARAAMSGSEASYFPSPPFPAFLATWAGARSSSRSLPLPAARAVRCVSERRVRDLTVHLYTAEPFGVSVVLIVRDGALAYVGFGVKPAFAPPAREFITAEKAVHETVPADVAAGAACSAISIRLAGQFGIAGWAMWGETDGAPHVRLHLARERYDAFSTAERAAFHRDCLEIARDAVTLAYGWRPHGVVVHFEEPVNGNRGLIGPRPPGPHVLAELRAE